MDRRRDGRLLGAQGRTSRHRQNGGTVSRYQRVVSGPDPAAILRGLDLGGQRGQVAQVNPGRRGDDQDRIGSVRQFPGSWPVQPQMVQASGRKTRTGPRRPALGRPGGERRQSDLRHLAHLAGVA